MNQAANLQVIVGMGATGAACARYFEQQQIPFAMCDTRSAEAPDVLAKAARIILSPGVALTTPLIQAQLKRGIPVVSDIELFAEVVKAPVIAITGTNAKSTVTTLVGEMMKAAGLKAQVGGNLGIPALDLVLADPNADVYVLELSSFQLETTYSLQPKVATILNITPDHLDRYENYEAYQQAKHRVYHHAAIAVCNRDDALTDVDLPHKFYFTRQHPGRHEFGLINKNNDYFLAFEDQLLMPVNELPVKGGHYQANALAALALGHGFGLAMAPMLSVLRSFKGLPHRCQFVRERHGVTWFNDSKGTNVGATQAAILGLAAEIKNKMILIAGGLGKGADFSPLIPLMEKYVRHVVLIGEAKTVLASLLEKHVPYSFAASMEEAVLQSDQCAQPGDIVLLSPACASWDMFKHYGHRGDVFMESVLKLQED